MFGPVTCLVMRQLIEMAKYTHLRSLEGQDLRNEHTHIYLSLCGACLPSPNLVAGCSECPTFSPSQPPARKSRRSAGKAAGEQEPEAYPLGYVEDSCELRTKLAGIINSRLVGDDSWRLQRLIQSCQSVAGLLLKMLIESAGRIAHAPRSISNSSCLGAHPANPANARKVSVGLACVMMRSRTFGVRPIWLVNRKDPLSLDGFEEPGADFPERYKPSLHDANTIVSSPTSSSRCSA